MPFRETSREWALWESGLAVRGDISSQKRQPKARVCGTVVQSISKPYRGALAGRLQQVLWPGGSSETFSQEVYCFAELRLPYILARSLQGSGWELEKVFPDFFPPLAVNWSVRRPQ